MGPTARQGPPDHHRWGGRQISCKDLEPLLACPNGQAAESGSTVDTPSWLGR